jgi:hypothetical protein
MRIFAIVSFLFILQLNPCHALTMTNQGNMAFLSGPIIDDDETRFKKFITDPDNAQIKIIRLHSGGGRIHAARLIARMIREKKLITFVDAKTDNCASACTLLFSAGIKRHYINAQDIEDGLYGLKQTVYGLGFHEGSNQKSSELNHQSQRATESMMSAYDEFGIPKAKELIALANPAWLYRISSRTALKLGIATHSTTP